MNNKKLLIQLLFLLFFIYSCGSGHSGIVDETDTEITATLVDTNGTILPNTPVRCYRHRDSSGNYLDSTMTDAEGKYTLKMDTLGLYAIWAETDTSAFFRENIALEKDKGGYDATDTLTPIRKIYVPVRVQPNHSPLILEAHILGTHIHPSFTKEGFMVLERVPNGLYNIMITVNDEYPGYSTITPMIEITPFTKDTLADTVVIPFHGIPVVEEIAASYDTLTAKATVSWQKSEFPYVSSYLIFRDPASATTISTEAIGVTSDTFFIDSMLTPELAAGDYTYRVKIRHSNEVDMGNFHFKDTISFVHPSNELNIIDATHDTLFLNKSKTIPLFISPWFGTEVTTSYALDNDTVFNPLADHKSLVLKVSDTYHDSLRCIVKVSATGRPEIFDTLTFTVSQEWEKVASPLTLSGTIQEVTLHNNIYYLSILEGNKQRVLSSSDAENWTILTDSTVTTSSKNAASNIISCAGKLWILDGEGIFYSSLDGISWTHAGVDQLSSPWSTAEYERKQLGSRGDSIEILYENSGMVDKSDDFATTDYHLFSFKPGATEIINPYEDNDKSFFLEASWVQFNTEKGFEFFIYEKKESAQNNNYEVVLYRLKGGSIQKQNACPLNNKDKSYSNWTNSPTLTGCYYKGGLYLYNGIGSQEDIFFTDYTEWEKETQFNTKAFPSIDTTSKSYNARLLPTEKGLILLSNSGIYKDFE